MDDELNPASADRDSRLTRRGFATVTMATGVAIAGAALAAEVVETDITITTADGACDAAFFHPAGKGTWPGVVIFTDILGLRSVFRDMGKREMGKQAVLGMDVVHFLKGDTSSCHGAEGQHDAFRRPGAPRRVHDRRQLVRASHRVVGDRCNPRYDVLPAWVIEPR